MALYAPTFLQGLQLGSPKMSFSNLPRPSRTFYAETVSNRWARLRPKRTSLGSQEKPYISSCPSPVPSTEAWLNDERLRMSATPEPAFRGDKPSHPIMDSVKLRNSEVDGHFLCIGNIFGNIIFLEFPWVCKSSMIYCIYCVYVFFCAYALP